MYAQTNPRQTPGYMVPTNPWTDSRVVISSYATIPLCLIISDWVGGLKISDMFCVKTALTTPLQFTAVCLLED